MNPSIDLGTFVDGGKPALVDLDILIKSRLLLQANSGGGKSRALRRLLEQSHGQVQHLVLDIEGEFHTLRERFDYVLAARTGGDTVADPRTAGVLARRLLELGVSAILDLYELQAPERIEFVKLFLEELIDAPKALWHPALVIIDEAHQFCPEKGSAESGPAVIDLMTRGRKRGFCGVLATQRLSKLHKDAAAEANVKLIGRATLDVDVKRASEELQITPSEGRTHLQALRPGQFFAYGPGLSDVVHRIHVGPVKTTHPEPGQASAPVPPPRAKVQKILAKLADLPKEAEQELRTAAELQRRVHELERQLAAKPAPPAPPPPPAPVAPKVVEIPALGKDVAHRLARAAEKVVAAAGELQSIGRAVLGAIGASETTASLLLEQLRRPTAAPPSIARRGPAPTPPRSPREISPNDMGPSVSPVSQKILDGLAELEMMGAQEPAREMVAFIAGYTNLTSKGLVNALGALRTAGLIDYPAQGRIALSEAGRRQAAAAGPYTDPIELQRRIVRMLGGASERILRPLLDAYPADLGREELAAAAGYTNLTSKGLVNALGRLRTLGFVDYPTQGRVAANPVLFLQERRG